MSFNTSNYNEQGGARAVIGGSLDVASGGDLDIESGGALKIAGTAITSTAAELNTVDGATAGTVVASKAVVVDSSKDIGDFRNLDCVNLDAGASGAAGTLDVFPATASKGKLIISAVDNTGDTAVTIKNAEHGQATVVTIPDSGLATSYIPQSTAALTVAEVDILDGATVTTAEVNLLDLSAQTEAITEAGAVSVVKRYTTLDSSGGTYAITLAAPDASMVGQVKVIEMLTAGNDVTMALTEVQGGTAATTATFNAANETLTLVAGSLKWNVVGESGVTLS